MNSLFILLFLSSVHFPLTKASIESLASVVRCATGLDYLRMFDTYNSYGCWCGIGGSGESVDEIDKCCQSHDKCWANSTCSWFQKYFGPTYEFKCVEKQRRRHPTSLKRRLQKKRQRMGADKHSHVVQGVPQCVWEDDFNFCAMQLCSCDKIFAECLAKLPVPTEKRDCDGEWRSLDDDGSSSPTKMPHRHTTTSSNNVKMPKQ